MFKIWTLIFFSLYTGQALSSALCQAELDGGLQKKVFTAELKEYEYFIHKINNTSIYIRSTEPKTIKGKNNPNFKAKSRNEITKNLLYIKEFMRSFPSAEMPPEFYVQLSPNVSTDYKGFAFGINLNTKHSEGIKPVTNGYTPQQTIVTHETGHVVAFHRLLKYAKENESDFLEQYQKITRWIFFSGKSVESPEYSKLINLIIYSHKLPGIFLSRIQISGFLQELYADLLPSLMSGHSHIMNLPGANKPALRDFNSNKNKIRETDKTVNTYTYLNKVRSFLSTGYFKHAIENNRQDELANILLAAITGIPLTAQIPTMEEMPSFYKTNILGPKPIHTWLVREQANINIDIINFIKENYKF